MSVVIDGTTYDIPFTQISRKADILFKDGAGRTQDGVLHAEAIGTYYNASLAFGMSANNVTEYANLWIKVTEPTADHEITLPDESGELTFSCYFANIKDQVSAIIGGVNYFRGLSFDVIATSPARTP